MVKKVVEEGWGKRLYRRMSELGYKDVTEFVRDTKIDLSFETCRRALHEGRFNIRHEYVVRLMQALDFTPQEIAEELKRRGDEHLHRLVAESSSGTVLSSSERRIINKLRTLNSPKVTQYVLDGLAMLLKGVGEKGDDNRSEAEGSLEE